MSRKVYWILSDKLGEGDSELGTLLMKNYIYSLARTEVVPERVILMNAGIKLACEGSASLDDLRLLEEKGALVRTCGTCLDFYGLRDKLAVGEAGNMPDAVAGMAGADDVVVLR